jgi:hypothetical protein
VRLSSPLGGDADVRVSLTVGSPILTASATTVSFSAEAGASAGASRSITLSNTGPGTTQTLGSLTAGPVSYSGLAGWLDEALAGETLQLTLAAVPARAGSYTATVPVTSTNGG